MRRRSTTWWLLIGWWWAPLCWAGRVLLWLVAWPLGLWRSLRHHARKQVPTTSSSPADLGKGYRYPWDDR